MAIVQAKADQVLIADPLMPVAVIQSALEEWFNERGSRDIFSLLKLATQDMSQVQCIYIMRVQEFMNCMQVCSLCLQHRISL